MWEIIFFIQYAIKCDIVRGFMNQFRKMRNTVDVIPFQEVEDRLYDRCNGYLVAWIFENTAENAGRFIYRAITDGIAGGMQ